jgi:hypothetical protein
MNLKHIFNAINCKSNDYRHDNFADIRQIQDYAFNVFECVVTDREAILIKVAAVAYDSAIVEGLQSFDLDHIVDAILK